MPVVNANSVDPDQTPHSATSDLGLHCLPKSHLWEATLNGLKPDISLTSVQFRRTDVSKLSIVSVNLIIDTRIYNSYTFWHCPLKQMDTCFVFCKDSYIAYEKGTLGERPYKLIEDIIFKD